MEKTVKPVMFGCVGTELTPEEKALFSKTNPFGLILFQHNCHNIDQVRSLVKEFRECVERDDAPVLIDQEGGRVQRLAGRNTDDYGHFHYVSGYNSSEHPGSKVWPRYPAMAVVGELYKKNREKGILAAELAGEALGSVLADVNVNVDAAPDLDISYPDTHAVIGDRSFGEHSKMVSLLGKKFSEGMKRANTIPCMKHIPGHGRATSDSHLELPEVNTPLEELKKTCFYPFKENSKVTPWAMVAHILFPAIDKENPSSQSKKVVDEIIRGYMDFDGLLCTDDLGMKALKGSAVEKAVKCVEAGIDVALCSHNSIEEKEQIINALPPMSEKSWQRWESSKATLTNEVKASQWKEKYEQLDNLLKSEGLSK